MPRSPETLSLPLQMSIDSSKTQRTSCVLDANDVEQIKKVQRLATKLVTSLRNMSYQKRLQALELPSLVYRRYRGDMIEVCKFIHGIYKTGLSLLSMHPCQHWEDIHTSWRKDIVTHSWDQISFHSELSIYGTVFQVRWYLLRQWIFSKKGWASIGKIAVFHWIQILLEDNKWSAKKPSWPNVKGWKQRWRWLKEVVPRCRFQWLKLKRHVPLCGGVVDSKLILVDRLLIFDTV